MRMRDHDLINTAARLQRGYRLIRNETDALPQHVPTAARSQQQRTLGNREFAANTDTEQAIVLFNSQREPLRQGGVREPRLPAPADILAVVFADGTMSRRFRCGRVLGTARLADIAMHGVSHERASGIDAK